MMMALLDTLWAQRKLRKISRGECSLRYRLVLLIVASTVPLLAFILVHQYSVCRRDVAATGR